MSLVSQLSDFLRDLSPRLDGALMTALGKRMGFVLIVFETDVVGQNVNAMHTSNVVRKDAMAILRQYLAVHDAGLCTDMNAKPEPESLH